MGREAVIYVVIISVMVYLVADFLYKRDRKKEKEHLAESNVIKEILNSTCSKIHLLLMKEWPEITEREGE